MNLKTTLSVCFLLIAIACSSPDKKESQVSTDENIRSLTPEEFKENLAAADAILIDVRTPEEVAQGVIPGAVNIDIKDSTFTSKINALEKDKSYFVYCKAGTRSENAAKQMEQLGLKNISVLDGGIVDWEKKGFETVKP
jgi:rhodanese-related sulfurtransferase